jgi:hypothetical protein
MRKLQLLMILGVWVRLIGPAAGEEQPIVAVFDLESKGSGLAPAELEDLASLLRARLAECGYQVVPPQQIRERLRQEQAETFKSCYDENCQIELGRELAAQAVVSSQVMRLGERCQLTAMLYDLQKAATGKAGVAEAPCGAADLLKAVREVAKTLCEALPAASRSQATSLTVQTEPDGAKVIVDGQVVGLAPLTLPVTPGRHEVRASLAKHLAPPASTVEAIAAQNTLVKVRLEPRPTLNPWGHAAFWTGAGLVLIGGLCDMMSRARADDFHQGEIGADKDSRAWMGGAYAGYISGGALLLTGAGLWIIEALREDEEPPMVAPAVAPAPGNAGAMLLLGGRF